MSSMVNNFRSVCFYLFFSLGQMGYVDRKMNNFKSKKKEKCGKEIKSSKNYHHSLTKYMT